MRIVDPLSDWSQPKSISDWANRISPPPQHAWQDYISYFLDPDKIVAVGRLLMPSFLVHDGGVFLEERFTLSGYEKWQLKFGDIALIEDVMNHQHMYDMFVTDSNIEENSYLALANLVSQMLQISLSTCFPDRLFKVYVSNSEHDYGPIVSFHSIKDGR